MTGRYTIGQKGIKGKLSTFMNEMQVRGISTSKGAPALGLEVPLSACAQLCSAWPSEERLKGWVTLELGCPGKSVRRKNNIIRSDNEVENQG